MPVILRVPDASNVNDTITLYTDAEGGANRSLSHSVRVFNSTNITLASTSVTNLTFDSNHWDTDSFHSTQSNTDRITIPAGLGGYYIVGGSFEFSANATGERILFINHSSAGNIAQQRLNNNGAVQPTGMSAMSMWLCQPGDYLQLQAYQSSGGNLTLAAQGDRSIEFWAMLLNPPASSASGGIPTGGSVGQALVNTSPGIASWQNIVNSLVAGTGIQLSASTGNVTITALGGGGGGGGSSLTPQSLRTTAFTAVAGNRYPMDTSSGTFAVTLPASPSNGDSVGLKWWNGLGAPTVNGTIDGVSGFTFSTQFQDIVLQWNSTFSSWMVI